LDSLLQFIDNVLAELYTGLFLPIKGLLPADTRRLVFIPHRFLHLFPLHAMWHEDEGQKVYLLEEYDEISYAPSAAALMSCLGRKRGSQSRFLALQDSNLTFAAKEVQAVSNFFPEARTLTPTDSMPIRKEVFFEEVSKAHVVLCTCHSLSGDPHTSHI